MKALGKRIARLEKFIMPVGEKEALILIHGQGRNPEEMIGLSWLDMPRMWDETVGDYIARVEAFLRATRGTALPIICFAEYQDDIE